MLAILVVALWCLAAPLSGQTGPPGGPVLPDDSRVAAREKELLDKAGQDSGPLGYAELASFYCDVLDQFPDLPLASKATVLSQGVAAADAALARDPRLTAALSAKGALRSAQADLEVDPPKTVALMKDADALQGVPPMPPAFEAAFLRLMPRRVGNGLPTPRKVKDAQPVYPPIAQSARVQGTIVMEAIVDDAGRVAAARVLRSIPLLDAAALAAVRQWEFQPARIDAQPTAIVMRMTIGFFLK